MSILKLPLWDFYKSLGSYPEYFGAEDYWLYIFLTLLCLGLVVAIGWFIYRCIYDAIDKKRATIETLSGELIDKRYKGEESHSGTGTAVIPNTSGGVGVGIVSTSSHSPEEFLFFIKADIIYKVAVDMQMFYLKNVGDKVRFERKIGGLSKEELYIQLA